ncbi:MAG: hypothetical protein ABL996_18570 [Micropepsaceae bacterium]
MAATPQCDRFQPFAPDVAVIRPIRQSGRLVRNRSARAVDAAKRVLDAGGQLLRLWRHPPLYSEIDLTNSRLIEAMIVTARSGSMPHALFGSIGKFRSAIAPKVLNQALRRRFDAEDYFKSAPKVLCLAAVTEAVGAVEARKLSTKTKGGNHQVVLAHFAKVGWLPVELRCASYNGPGKSAARKVAA